MINWKVRCRRKSFWLSLFGLLLLLAQQLGVKLPDNISEIVNTLLSIAVLVGIINDPTTAGLSDSERAMSYDKPK
ncbi:phage holin [Streptococcus sp. sy004]|uniref:phage holin n=1 Tax=Streptococcus sp. sy004 TaxID=2600149 RepID=UPI0011B85170|nr:phage holin [Streptococcus sp. sy004]TWT12086.1 phage holin [Streptococcus sp. sy004]